MKTRLLPPLMAAAFLANTAFALPDPKADTSKVNGLLEGIGQVIGDADVPNLIYVKPSDLKVTGTFSQTSMGIDCDNLDNFRRTFFRMPAENEIQKVIDENRFYSPLFEKSIAIEARFLNITNEINNLRMEAVKLQRENKAQIDEYQSAYAEVTAIDKQLDLLEKKYEKLHSDFLNELVTAQNDAERLEIRANYKELMKEVKERRTALTARKDTADQRFVEATKNHSRYKEEMDQVRILETDLMASLDKYRTVADDLYEAGEDELNALAGKIIGKASVGYSLSTGEKVALLSKRVKEAGLDVDVRALDIFNVKLNPIVMVVDTEVKTSFNDVYKIANYEVDSKTQIPLGVKKRMLTLPAQVEVEGEEPRELEHEVSSFDSNVGSAQGFSAAVTVGGYCGDVQHTKRNYSVRNRGLSMEAQVTYPTFKPAGNSVLFAQTMPLTYNYYQRAEPIAGKCQLDISKTSNYVRDHGKKKSGGIFNRKSKSWDHTRHDLRSGMGMFCEFTASPQGSTPEESDLINAAMEKALYQDMFSMFLTSYAKDFKIIPLNKTELGPESKFFDKIGSGMMNLCGQNKYCEFGSIVLKSMDDLVGSRHSGKSSSKQTITGKISKNFNKKGYLVSEGSLNVDMKVCMNANECI